MEYSFQPADCSILVVDDVSENIQVIGSILLQHGYQVSYALSGPEALAMVNQKQYDLIMLDILMPGMDGYQVCEKIKSNEVTRDIPVVFLTAKTDPISIVKGFQLGAVDYLGKPFNAEELLARVNTQLKVKKQTEGLENWNKVLEEKVAERTVELKEAHEELALLENAKSNFLMLISHELRTPLNVFNGLIEEISTSLHLSVQEESIRYLKQSSDKLINLAENALLITELQSGKYKLNFSTINLKEMCKVAIESFADDLKEKSIKLIFEFGEGAETVRSDYNLINSCIRNLTHNAIKYSPRDGKIIFSSDKTDSFTNFHISDVGAGFSNDQLEKLFKLFGKPNVDTKNEGFGLDLASVKLIMDIHSGTIKAGNAKGGGAEVSLSFPR